MWQSEGTQFGLMDSANWRSGEFVNADRLLSRCGIEAIDPQMPGYLSG